MKRAAIIVGIVLAIGLAIQVWYSSALGAAGTGDTAVEIKEGARPDEIAELLEQKKIIKSARAFGWHVKANDLSSKLQAGRYVLSGQEKATVIAAQLAEGPKQASQFTIKEGVTQDQIAKLLGDLGIVDEDEFKKLKASDFPEYDFLREVPTAARLEGFLFPETYAIPDEGTSTKEVAKIMLDQFGKELTPDLRSQIKASGQTIYETVILASLVEEEVKTETDRKLVAGVLFNRIERGMNLGIDATVRYAVGKPTGALTQADLDTDDPYNTRKFKGLPPGPIANPGIVAITATINPTASEYLFYLTGKDGKTYFAKTNEEHEQNKSDHLN